MWLNKQEVLRKMHYHERFAVRVAVNRAYDGESFGLAYCCVPVSETEFERIVESVFMGSPDHARIQVYGGGRMEIVTQGGER